MSDAHSTAPTPTDKPAKPTPDFPLTAHAAGYWCKKIKGKTHYFGRWDDPDGALRAYRDFVAGKPVSRCKTTPVTPVTPTLRPAKPYLDFPLFPHAAGVWAKKIRGKLHYFGPWEDWQGALTKYQEQRDDLHAGRTPRVSADGFTIKNLLDHFRTSKLRLRDAGEITPRTYGEYVTVCNLIAETFGVRRLVIDLAAEDFETLRAELAKRLGPVSLANHIQRIRTVFKYGYDANLIDRPVRFGPAFKKPSRKVMRLHRNNKAPRLFTAEELRKLIDGADRQVKAMVLLAINAGFGNADCGTLPQAALDLDGGWLNYPRPKTGVPRRVPLWPETVAALREAIAHRPKAKDPADDVLVFITKYGGPWHTGTTNNPLSWRIIEILEDLGIRREGLSFYSVRHTFETVAGGSLDQVAVNAIMGHVDETMAGVYREEVSDARLLAVVNYVHGWLFPPVKKAKKQARAKG